MPSATADALLPAPACIIPPSGAPGRRRPMQTVKQAIVLALIVLPLTLGVYLTLRPLPPRPTMSERRRTPPSVPVKSSEPQPVSADPLVALNDNFRGAYAAGRKETLRHTDPVILVEGDTVVLRRKG